MAIPITLWDEGYVLDFEVTLSAPGDFSANAGAGTDISVSHQGIEIAQGWAHLPHNVTLGSRTTSVRLATPSGNTLMTGLCVVDIMIDGQWMSELTNKRDPLHSHRESRPVSRV